MSCFRSRLRGSKKWSVKLRWICEKVSKTLNETTYARANTKYYLLGCNQLFSMTNEHNIPILVFSGGITQLIEMVIT